ncbi:MAG: nicotinamidase-related amidase [Glaciecola sp.]
MLKRTNTGLIVVDIQGKLSRLVHNSDAMFANVSKLIKACSLLEVPIIVVEQNPEKLGRTDSELQPLLASYPCITKFAFNACNEPHFVDELNKIDLEHYLVCGIEAHVCVYQTVMGLKAMGKSVELVSDCVSSREESNRQVAINKLQAQGVSITSAEMCLFELMKNCKDSKFKEFLSIIR